MAIRTPGLDYNTLGNAFARNENVDQYGIQTKQQQQNIDMINQDAAYKKAKTVTKTISAVADFVTTVGPALQNIAQAKQLEVAKTDVLSAQTENQKLMYQSLLKGSTYIGPDGKFVMDESYTQWQQEQLNAIDNSKDMKTVKEWKRNALLQTFQNGQGVLIDQAYNNYKQSYNESFNNNLYLAKQNDIAAGSVENGAAIISGRVDWSQSQKQAAYEAYQIEVQRGFDTQNISNIAASEGIAAATTAAYKLQGYTPEEIQSIVTTAAKTDQQLTNAAATTVSNVMSKGLESGKNASDLWTEVETAVTKMPEDRKQVALSSAKSAQITYATEKASQMWVADADADLGFLQERRDSIKGGALAEELFFNLPEVQDTYVSLYDKQIAAVQKVQGTVSDETVKINKTLASSIYSQFQNGAISGNNAVASLMSIGQNTAGLEDDVYAMDFITKIKDNVVPAKFKPAADSFVKQMDSLNWGISGKRDEFTPEQEAQLANSKTWAYGMIADTFMATATNSFNDANFTETLSNIKRIYTSDVLDVTRSATINSKTPANDMVNLGYEMGKNKTVFFDDTTGQVQWADPSVKTAFTKVAGQFNTSLTAVGVEIHAAPHPLVIGDEVFPVPQLKGIEKDGLTRLYTFDRSNIFSSEDGGVTWKKRWYWENFDIDDTKLVSGELKHEKTDINNYFDQFR